MRRLFIKDLRPGQVLPQALFTPSGLKLLPAGTRLSRGRIASLRRAYESELYLATSYAELRSELSDAPVVATEAAASGWRPAAERTPEQTARREWMREIRRTERDIDEQFDLWAPIVRRVEPAARPLELAATGREGWPSGARLRAYRSDRVARIAAMHRSIAAREHVELNDALYVVRELMDLYAGYPDRFARLATMAAGSDHPVAEHALRVCALATAIGVQLGWSLEDVQMAGLAGLFADLGMVLEPVDSGLALDDITASRLRRHPIASAVMMSAIKGAPEAVRLAVAQHHERLNGRGYPLGARGEQIHDVALVVAVADCFGAAVAARPHRAAKRPHAALVNVCREALTGSLDRRVTMALVRVTGVFPVGAAVSLNRGGAAVVMSSRADEPGRPCLRLLDDLGDLDLSVARDVRITAELAPSESEMLGA